MKERRTYAFPLWINGRLLPEVVIDPHYEKKHPDISDPLILALARKLDGRKFQPDDSADGWEFFLLDRLEHQGKSYRLV